MHHNIAKAWPSRSFKTRRNIAGDHNTQWGSAIKELRCEHYHSHHSPAYHGQHWQDPVRHPAVGICLRWRTGCASAKEVLQGGGRIQ
jgi:hypothetical protein